MLGRGLARRSRAAVRGGEGKRADEGGKGATLFKAIVDVDGDVLLEVGEG
jgi:hypothetical protein